MSPKKRAISATRKLRHALEQKELFPHEISFLEQPIRELCSYMKKQAIMKGK
jgi:hypothetical protein